MNMNQNSDKYSLKDNLIKCYKTWCIFSQIHGLSFMGRARRLFNRLIWIVCILICFGLCSNAFIRITQKYFNYDIVASVKIDTTIPALFPAVTICKIFNT